MTVRLRPARLAIACRSIPYCLSAAMNSRIEVIARKVTTIKWDFGESRSGGGKEGGQFFPGRTTDAPLSRSTCDSRKHLASTSEPDPVAVSGSSSGFWAPTQAASFWSRQNWRVQVKHGLAGLAGRYRGMMVELPKHAHRQYDMPVDESEAAACAVGTTRTDMTDTATRKTR